MWSGSPPRMWGLPLGDRATAIRAGLTPTRAGNTAVLGGEHVLAGLNPHACGDDAEKIGTRKTAAGTLPTRVRKTAGSVGC